MTIFDLTEADDAPSGAHALEALRDIAAQYDRGDETMGVFQMYQDAARRAGCTLEEIQQATRR